MFAIWLLLENGLWLRRSEKQTECCSYSPGLDVNTWLVDQSVRLLYVSVKQERKEEGNDRKEDRMGGESEESWVQPGSTILWNKRWKNGRKKNGFTAWHPHRWLFAFVHLQTNIPRLNYEAIILFVDGGREKVGGCKNCLVVYDLPRSPWWNSSPITHRCLFWI